MQSLPLLLAKLSQPQVAQSVAEKAAERAIENEVRAILVGVTVVLVMTLLISSWKLFQKAGRPGWHALVPFYNTFAWVDILGRPAWVAALLFVPWLDILVGMFLCTDIAKCFGKKTGFAIGLMFLPFIFLPILAFGRARYLGPVTEDTSPTSIG